ncbi:MAG TPA: MBL fold metallo-hydrolase [Vicinamibacterales bacterium]|nr:MBL fold metallo-hydrolase [Vicinamibacterales bacterium]
MSRGLTAWRRASAALWFAAFTAVASAQTTAAPDPVLDIAPLRGDLYLAREGDQSTVFLVTPDGILVGDPLNLSFARRLRDELTARFPRQTVRYVVLSHHHFDRAEGASVFTGAEIIAHARFNSELSSAGDGVPAFLGVQDRNRNRQLDPAEIEGPNAALLLSRDRNHDGTVTPGELYGNVRSVRTSFGRRREIRLGTRRVELVHPGNWHSADMATLFFPGERVVFAVDAPPVDAVPFAFGTGNPADVYDWLHAIAPLDFDTLVLENGRTVTAAALRELTAYLDDLHAEVAVQYEQWRSVGAVQATTIPENHRESPHYAGRTRQIADVYATVRLRRIELATTAAGSYSQRDPSFCQSYVVCAAGGAVPAASAGASVLIGRHVGVVGELASGQQSWSTRRLPLYDEEVALRQARGSILVRIDLARTIAVLGGISQTWGDARGMNIVRGRVAPIGGRHAIQHRDRLPGFTTGVDLAKPVFHDRAALVAPLRVTYTPRPLPWYWPSRIDASAGIGIRVRLLRVVQ